MCKNQQFIILVLDMSNYITIHAYVLQSDEVFELVPGSGPVVSTAESQFCVGQEEQSANQHADARLRLVHSTGHSLTDDERR